MTMGPMIGRPGEYTKVSKETEVTIPWKTYVLTSVVLMIVGGGLWLIGWLLWFQARLKSVSFGRWLGREWGDWMARRWPWIVISLILCWIGPSAIAYLYRLFTEQIVKQMPQYTPYPSELGRWRPFVRPPAVEYEAEAVDVREEVDVNLTMQPKGRKRPQIKRIEGMPTDRRSKEFYRAVTKHLAPFSESGAGNYHISQRGFRKIRDALMARGLADWKDATRHKSGVDLNDGAFGLMSALSSRQ